MEVFFAEGTNRISRHDLQKVHPFNGGHRRPSFPTDYHYRFPTKTKRELTRVRCFVPDRNLLGVFWGEFLWKVQKKSSHSFLFTDTKTATNYSGISRLRKSEISVNTM